MVDGLPIDDDIEFVASISMEQTKAEPFFKSKVNFSPFEKSEAKTNTKGIAQKVSHKIANCDLPGTS